MNPIAAIALLAALGFAAYKFITQPKIIQERAPETPGEKALKQVDETLENILNFGSDALKFFNDIFTKEAYPTFASQYLQILHEHKSKGIPIKRFYTESLHKMYAPGIPLDSAGKLFTNESLKSTKQSDIGIMIRSAISEMMRISGINLYHYSPYLRWASEQEFEQAYNSTIALSKYRSRDLARGKDVTIRKVGFPRNSFDVCLGLAGKSDFTHMPVFENLHFYNPYVGSQNNKKYLLSTLYPGYKNAHVIFVYLDGFTIKEIKEIRLKDCSDDAINKISRLSMFGNRDNVFAGFNMKLSTVGRIYLTNQDKG